MEIFAIHQTADASAAARWLREGRRGRVMVWGGGMAGHVIPLALILTGFQSLLLPAGLLALTGLLVYEHLYVRAGQSVALS